MSVTDQVAIEVAFGRPDSQSLVALSLEKGATVAVAIDRSGLAEDYPDEQLADLSTGIWGRIVDRDCILKDGDRVEVYRPLLLDPRESRRRLAQLGLTMRESERN